MYNLNLQAQSSANFMKKLSYLPVVTFGLILPGCSTRIFHRFLEINPGADSEVIFKLIIFLCNKCVIPPPEALETYFETFMTYHT